MKLGGYTVDFEPEEKIDEENSLLETPGPERMSASADKTEQVRKTFVITTALDRALRVKAADLGVSFNEVVRNCMYENIEMKYFKEIK